MSDVVRCGNVLSAGTVDFICARPERHGGRHSDGLGFAWGGALPRPTEIPEIPRLACAKLGPYGRPCMKPHVHKDEARYGVSMQVALEATLHRDDAGNAWTDVNVTTGAAWAPPPVVAPTITAMAAKCIERMAVLDRVRPVLEAAIKDAKPEDVAAWAIVAVRVSEAILRDGGR